MLVITDSDIMIYEKINDVWNYKEYICHDKDIRSSESLSVDFSLNGNVIYYSHINYYNKINAYDINTKVLKDITFDSSKEFKYVCDDGRLLCGDTLYDPITESKEKLFTDDLHLSSYLRVSPLNNEIIYVTNLENIATRKISGNVCEEKYLLSFDGKANWYSYTSGRWVLASTNKKPLISQMNKYGMNAQEVNNIPQVAFEELYNDIVTVNIAIYMYSDKRNISPLVKAINVKTNNKDGYEYLYANRLEKYVKSDFRTVNSIFPIEDFSEDTQFNYLLYLGNEWLYTYKNGELIKLDHLATEFTSNESSNWTIFNQYGMNSNELRSIPSKVLTDLFLNPDYANDEFGILYMVKTKELNTQNCKATFKLQTESNFLNNNDNFVLEIVLSGTDKKVITYDDIVSDMFSSKNIAQYNINLNAPFAKSKSGINEIIDVETGNVCVSYDLFSLNGRGGVKTINLSLKYNSTKSNILSESVEYGRYGYVNKLDSKTGYNRVNSLIGAGWSFEFPYVESLNKKIYVHLPCGSVYEYDEEKNELKDYKLKAVSFTSLKTDTVFSIKSGYSLSYIDGTSYDFDTDGYLIKQRDKFKNEVTYNWSSDKLKLESITDNCGQKIEFEYDNDIINIKFEDREYNLIREKLNNNTIFNNNDNEENYYLTKFVDPQGRETNYKYDIDTFYSYDKYGNITSKTDGEGNDTYYSYDKLDRVTKEILEDKSERLYVYDDLKNTITTTDATNAKLFYSYNKYGYLDEIVDVLTNERLIKREYDNKHRIIKEIDGNGTSKNIVYDDLDRIIKVCYNDFNESLLSKTELIYDEAYLVNNEYFTKLTALYYDESSVNKTVYLFDYKENQVEKSILGNEKNQTTKYYYDYVGNNTLIIDALGNKTSMEYDIFSNPKTIEYANGNIEHFTYDFLSNQTSYTNAENKTIYKTFDSLGRQISEKIPFEIDNQYSITKWDYDSRGNVIKTVDPNNGISEFEYNSRGFMTNSKTFINNNNYLEVAYEYDAEGRVVKEMYGNDKKHIYSNSLDHFGRVVEKTDALGNKQYFEYDTLGNVVKTVDRNGLIIKNKYDGLGRKISQNDEKDGETNYKYNLLGQLLKVSNNKEAKEYEYDKFGNLINTKDANKTENMTYDILGNLTSYIINEQKIIKYCKG